MGEGLHSSSSLLAPMSDKNVAEKAEAVKSNAQGGNVFQDILELA